MEQELASLKVAIEQLVLDPAARQQLLDLLNRLERSSQRATFSADRTRNDPMPVPNPHERAVRMAVEMRERVFGLLARWRKRGFDLDFGVGIAHGFATIGAIGFEGRWDYGAIGTVTNLAARLCGEAAPGQILISQRLLGLVEDFVDAEPVGDLTLKGFARPVPTFNVRALRTG